MSMASGTLSTDAATLRALMRLIISVNFIYVLIPETFIWIIFSQWGVSLSPIHKVGLLLLVFIYLVLFDSASQKKILSLGVLLSISTILSIPDANFSSIVESIEDVTRLLLLFATYYYFKTFAERGSKGIKPFDQFIWVSFAVVAVNLGLGAMGYGNAQRGMGIGSRGFFNAGNDASTITTMIAAFVLSIKYKNGWLRMMPYLLVFVFFGYVLNTKAFLGGLLIILVVLPLYGHISMRLTTRNLKRMVGVAILSPLFVLLAVWIFDRFDLWERYLTFLDQYKDDSWITFVLSRRDEHLAQGIAFMQQNFSVLDYIFGYSSGEFLAVVPSRAEIDPFEIFFYFGLVGLIAVYGWFIVVMVRSYRIGKDTSSPLFVYQRGLFAMNLYILFQSVVAGHVFMSVLVCVFLGLLNAISFLKNE
jgi:hypothetical protein